MGINEEFDIKKVSLKLDTGDSIKADLSDLLVTVNRGKYNGTEVIYFPDVNKMALIVTPDVFYLLCGAVGRDCFETDFLALARKNSARDFKHEQIDRLDENMYEALIIIASKKTVKIEK